MTASATSSFVLSTPRRKSLNAVMRIGNAEHERAQRRADGGDGIAQRRVHRDQLPVENPFHEERVHDQHHAEHRALEIERGVRMVVPAIRAARVHDRGRDDARAASRG